MALDSYIAALESGEDFLLEKFLSYGDEAGYTRYTGVKGDRWRLALRQPVTVLTQYLAEHETPELIHADEKLDENPIAAFGLLQARQHRMRGVRLDMFLGLAKLFRQAFVDLVHETEMSPEETVRALAITHRFFDKFELGVGSEWVRNGNGGTTVGAHAAEMARVTERMMDNLIEGINLARVGDGAIVGVNRRFEEMFGYGPGEIVGKHFAVLIAPSGEEGPGDVAEQIRQALEKVGSWRGRVRNVRKDGSEFWCHAGVSLFEHPEHGKVFLSVHVDMTRHLDAQQREAEVRERLSRAERLESLGVLTGGVAHDLNNVVGPMVSLSAFLGEDIDRLPPDVGVDIDDMKESVDLIRTSALRAMRTIEDLVTIGRRGTHQSAPVDINRVVKHFLGSLEMRDIAGRYPQVAVDAELAAGEMVFPGVESQLERVVLNLVLNGVEAVDGEGTVTVRTARAKLDAPVDAYEVIAPGEYVVLEVGDSGRGVCAENLGRIFEPFVSFKKREGSSGSGLGLSVVRSIVKDHEGFIDVTSGVDGGTVFSLYFPVNPGPGRQ